MKDIRKRPARKRVLKLPGVETASERQARTAVSVITQSPFYSVILKMIRQGTPNTTIAAHCVTRGYLQVNQKTAVSYLQYFRAKNPSICAPVVKDDITAEDNLDNLFDAAGIALDEETELLRLISVQKARLGINYKNERNLGALLDSGSKDVKELRELLEALARLRGKLSSGGASLDVNVHSGYQEAVRGDLQGLTQDENTRNMLSSMVGDLVQAVGRKHAR